MSQVKRLNITYMGGYIVYYVDIGGGVSLLVCKGRGGFIKENGKTPSVTMRKTVISI